jgi:hypothetical protein
LKLVVIEGLMTWIAMMTGWILGRERPRRKMGWGGVGDGDSGFVSSAADAGASDDEFCLEVVRVKRGKGRLADVLGDLAAEAICHHFGTLVSRA